MDLASWQISPKQYDLNLRNVSNPIGSMYGIYVNIWGILMVNVTIYGIHGSYGNVSKSTMAIGPT